MQIVLKEILIYGMLSIKIKTNELSKKAIAKKIILYILIGVGIISVIVLILLFMRNRYKRSNKF